MPESSRSGQSTNAVIRLYIGLCTRTGDSIAPEEVIAWLGERVPSFSVVESIGYLEGKREPSLIVTVAGIPSSEVITFGQELRGAFNQHAVGIEVEGRYRRVFEPIPHVEQDQKNLSGFVRATRDTTFEDLSDEMKQWWLNRY